MEKVLTEREKGFLEGLIDADGSISLSKVKTKAVKGVRGINKRGYAVKIQLSISNNSLELIAKLQEILGTNLTPVNKKGTNNYKVAFKHTVLRWLFPQIRLIIKENRRIKSLEILNHIQKRKHYHQKDKKYEEELEKMVNEFY